MMRPSVVPELYVTDLNRSLRFYVETLGFEVEYRRSESAFVALGFFGSRVMLEQVADMREASEAEFEAGGWRTGDLEFPFGRGVSFEVVVSDVELMHRRVIEKGYSVKLGLQDRLYRVGDESVVLRQFLVMDPDGYLVRLAQRID